MGTEENVAALVNDERDDLETMSNEETQSQCKALTKTTGKRCKKTASPGSECCPVHQRMVGRQVQQANTKRTPLEEEAEVEKESRQASSKKKKEWDEHYHVSLSFEYKVNEQGKPVVDERGERVWQTQPYDTTSGFGKPLPGLDTASWVNWILERADLPVATEPPPTETEVATPAMPHSAQLEILDVQVSKAERSPGVREKRLMAEIRFQVSGTEAETMAADRVPFWIQFHTVDLESKVVSLVASEQSQLQPEIFEYTSQQAFPVSDLGRYELQSIVLLLPPGEMMAFHQGPTIKVVP